MSKKSSSFLFPGIPRIDQSQVSSFPFPHRGREHHCRRRRHVWGSGGTAKPSWGILGAEQPDGKPFKCESLLRPELVTALLTQHTGEQAPTRASSSKGLP